MEETKACSKCKKEKIISEFYSDISNPSGLHSHCKVCKNEASKIWKNNNPYKRKAHNIKTRYGLIYEDFIKMHELQDSKCPGCNEKISIIIGSENPAVIDHNHETGDIRSLLCNKCNQVIGLVKEKQTTLENLSNYLRKYNNE